MPAGVILFLVYGFIMLGIIGLTLPLVIELAIEAPVSPLGLLYMLLLAYLIFTLTLVLQRKQAAYNLALGLATLGLTLVFINPLGAISFVAALVVIVALRRRTSRAWFSEL
jgi:hypothetical protein